MFVMTLGSLESGDGGEENGEVQFRGSSKKGWDWQEKMEKGEEVLN